MTDEYKIGDRVFAKMKGYPPWPAKVMERVAGKEEKYRINFYGTHDEATVKTDQMFIYNTATKAKYGKGQRKAQFKDAMKEIEADVAATPAESSEDADEKQEGEDSDGELMIDEGPPSLPPVLTREVNNKPDSTEVVKGKRPRTLSKRDSVSSASGTPVLAAPATPEPNQEPTTEIVSRSGRRIKPKRFADDEITSPITTVSKAAAKASAAADDGSPPAKKTRRGSKSVGGKNATPITPVVAPEEKPETPSTRAAAGKAKGATATAAPTPTKQLSRLSPDIVSSPMNNRGPPSLRPAPVKRSGSGSNKQIPSLSASSSTPKTAALRKSERKTRSKSIEEPETKNEIPDLLPAESEEIDDKENSESKPLVKEETNDLNGESVEPPVIAGRRRVPVPAAPKAPTTEQKVRVAGKNGLQYEISYDTKKSDGGTEEENKAWQSAAIKNVEKLKTDLAKGDIESQDIINSTAETLEDVNIEEIKAREKRNIQIKSLRLEGEVIEIIGEIVGCLNVSSADCDRAIELLERLEGHQLNALMLKKHTEVVETVKRLRCYVGNVEVWGLDEEQKEQFEAKALAIRLKAVEIYKHFQDLFCTNPGDSFIKIYDEEVERFKESVAGLPMKTVLGLTEVDETGELQEFELEVNGQDQDEAEIEADVDAEEAMETS